MKIGIIGYSPLNFVKGICRELILNGHTVTVFTVLDEVVLDNVEYNFEVVHLDLFNKSDLNKFFLFLKGLIFFNIKLFKTLFLREFSSFKDFYQYIYCYKYYNRMMQLDCCNFQSLTLSNMWSLYLNDDCKIVSSFWGTDLNFDKSKPDKLNKKLIVQKSDLITLQSEELYKVFLKKYEFHPNVEKILFPIRNEFFILADSTEKESSEYFSVAIGYNGFENQNHDECIKALMTLPYSIKDRLLLKLFLHYGGTEAYHQSLISQLNDSNIKYKIFDKRLSLEELVYEKVNTDLFLFLPSIDGFSASVSEALYTNNVVICGSWLPYSRYRKNKLEIQWLDDIQDLGRLLHEVFHDIENLRLRSAFNKEKVTRTLDYSGNLAKWVEILSK